MTKRPYLFWSALGTALRLASAATGASEGFQMHARFKGVGMCLKQLVGPGPEPGSERLFASHINLGDTLDIVAVDPLTGAPEVFVSPVPTESGAWALAFGPDGQLYVGTLPNAHILRLDWKERRLVDLGRAVAAEQYIWELALGADQKLYGGTGLGARLFRFDPATGKAEDLGRMHPIEQYVRYLAADDQGFVYMGVGIANRHLIAYEIASGEHRDILPPELQGPGTCAVAVGDDGQVYGVAGPQHLRLHGGQATPIPPEQFRGAPALKLADGRTVKYDGESISVQDPKTGNGVQNRVDYPGKSQSLFRFGLGPEGRLYGSTAMPLHFFWADPESDRWEEISQPGNGEVYSFLAHGDVLIAAAYGATAPLMIYRPGKPYAPDTAASGNPWWIYPQGVAGSWRPVALINGPGNQVYIGGYGDYGQVGGPLCILNPTTGHVDTYLHVVQDQSVTALANLRDGRIIGGTSVQGGSGSLPTQTEARLFLWDAEKREKLFETVPAPGQGSIDALAVGRDGLVYGFAGPVLFIFDPVAQKVIETGEHGLGSVIYNAVAAGPGNELFGLAANGVFTMDTQARRPRVLAQYPGGIQQGFAIRGPQIFFASGPQIVSYTLP